MNRKIKFRGRCADTWRKGDHLTYADGECIKAWMGSISPEYTVEPDTVGQFTGLYDCSGAEIYEGDICELVDYSYRLLVGWDEYDCRLAFFTTNGNLSDFGLHSVSHIAMKVIGNIHDNPELLKEE